MDLCQFESLDEIQKVFSVETLSKDFYKELSHWYFAAMSEIEFPNDINEPETQLKANSLIRLITRLIFVWFMKQKQLVPDDLFDTEKLKNLINDKDSTGSTYYKAILQNLFFATLSTPKEVGRKFVSSQYGVQNFFRYKRFIKDEERFLQLMDEVPFLNGGLFESLDIIEPENDKIQRVDCFSDNPKNEHLLKVPDYLFFGKRTADISTFYEAGNYDKVQVEGIIDLLNRFDFTIDENTANDQEVALDPELLGLVFENLLASYNPETQSTARKESGSFYTPRPIVDYMAEEAIVQYLHNETQLEVDDLRKLFKVEDEILFLQKEKQVITEALSTLKVIDPACGSGAFPMGVLLKMVQVLNHIDPENTFWRNAQLDRLKAKTFEAFDNKDLESIKKEIDAIFNSELNDADYARKLYLIENCIYGVDIQPIAMQIAKLRFFISLLVEQRIDKTKENFGILALPNLETKFVAANTLIQPHKPELDLFTNQELVEKQEELKKCRHKLFSARTLKTKKKYRALDKEIRDEMAELLKKPDTFSHQDAKQFAQWDPYKTDSFSPWFDPEWMFGVKGFDIVIGNPPYIKEYVYKSAFDGFRESKYYKGKMDLWHGFTCVGIDFLNDNGILAFIAQNNWVTNFGAEKMREKVINDTRIINITDFNHYLIFESAAIQTSVMIFQKDNITAEYDFDFRKLSDKNTELTDVIDLIEYKQSTNNILYRPNFIRKSYIGKYLLFNEEPIENVLYKILKKGKFYLNKNEIANGIHSHHDRISIKMTAVIPNSKVGDGIFALDEEEVKELKLTEKEDKLLKPYYETESLKRYYGEKDYKPKKYIIYTNSSFNNPSSMDAYPNLKKHLDKYLEVITSDNKPYGLHRARDERFFIGEKIISLRKCSDRPTFTFTDFDCYVSATFYVIKSDRLDLKYLTALLNSNLLMFWFKYKGKMQGSNFQIDKQPLLDVPIFSSKDDIQEIISKKVTTILTKKAKQKDTSSEEIQIDIMVYKLYELTHEEVKIIDPAFPLSQEEYDNYQIEE